MTAPDLDPATVQLIADLRYAARSGALLLRDAAAGRLDPDLLRGAAKALEELAERGVDTK